MSDLDAVGLLLASIVSVIGGGIGATLADCGVKVVVQLKRIADALERR
jgi:hypothetical protein